MRFSKTITISALTVGLIGLAAAEAPKKQGLSRYSMLWTNSPFTVKPTETAAEAVNPLNDWALGGVSEVNGGYYLILMNRKKPAETEIVEPGIESPFKVLAVRRDPVDYLKTQVQVSYRGESGWVSYDEKLLTLAKGPAGGAGHQPPGAGQMPNQPPGIPSSGPPGGAGAPATPNIPGLNPATGTNSGGGMHGGGGGGGGQQQGQPRPRQRIIPPANR